MNNSSCNNYTIVIWWTIAGACLLLFHTHTHTKTHLNGLMFHSATETWGEADRMRYLFFWKSQYQFSLIDSKKYVFQKRSGNDKHITFLENLLFNKILKCLVCTLSLRGIIFYQSFWSNFKTFNDSIHSHGIRDLKKRKKKVNIQPGRRKEQEKVQVPGAMAKAELLEHR